MFGKPSASSAWRIAATRPSIMSEGATMSAPARACETAVAASHFERGVVIHVAVDDLAAMAVAGVFAIADVGHDQQVRRFRCLMARMARCTMPSSA